jgi:hypothetical protein
LTGRFQYLIPDTFFTHTIIDPARNMTRRKKLPIDFYRIFMYKPMALFSFDHALSTMANALVSRHVGNKFYFEERACNLA